MRSGVFLLFFPFWVDTLFRGIFMAQKTASSVAQEPTAEKKISVQEVTADFLAYIATIRALSENTVINYKNDLTQFASLLPPEQCASISAVTPEDIRQCIGKLSKEKRAAASINRFIAAVRTLFSYCKKRGCIENNPASEIKTVKLPKRLPRFMTGAEVDKLCAEPERHELLWQTRDKALFEMFYSSGCRVSELASLVLDDFSAGFDSAIVTGKGKKDRRVYFEADAQNALRMYLKDRRKRFGLQDTDRAVFVNQRGKKLTVGGITYILSRYSGAEGTKHHVSPHSFRHTFATAMITNGADVRIVQELLGHSSISTTQRYTHISTQQLIDTYNKAHPHGGSEKS